MDFYHALALYIGMFIVNLLYCIAEEESIVDWLGRSLMLLGLAIIIWFIVSIITDASLLK